jgi:hypothetical protein
MHLSILHRTTFTYAGKAHDSFNEVRLRPIDDAFQKCVNFDLRLEPTATPQDVSEGIEAARAIVEACAAHVRART